MSACLITLLPSAYRTSAQNQKRATLVATDGFGHRGIVRQPMVWNKVTEFFGKAAG
ncbi:MAG: hypothetical protein H7A01_14570 [Hahellaceae bacterium]|nr:hypothetical protein [Hahellaceae bacterium]MCP5210282.1 hypothetical protein [Hahellaceae bacterium]